MSLGSLIGWLGSDAQPAVGAFLHIRVVPVRVPAIIPIIGRFLRGWGDGFLPLDINRRRYRHGDHRGISIIGRIIWPSVTVPSIRTIAPVITRTEAVAEPPAIAPISAPAPAWIEAAYAIKAHAGMVMVPAVMVVPP